MEFPARQFTSEGRFAGSYVYFLCCAADSPDSVYIKVGVSDTPTRRLYALVNNCGLRPLTFGTCNVRSRRVAFKIETAIHRDLKAWRTNGEWYRFHKNEKSLFAAIRDKALDPFRAPSWPLPIVVHGVMPVIKAARRRSLFYCRVLRRRGKAYQDFRTHGGTLTLSKQS